MDWLVAALVIAGCLAVLIGSRLMVTHACADLRLEFQRQIDALSAKLTSLEQTASAQTAALALGKIEASAAPSSVEAQMPVHISDEITPETLARIAETVTALLGRTVRIRSVKILPTSDAVANPWAQQGRAVIQASRNFASRRR